MIEFWKQFEGELIDGSYTLLRCLSGGESSSVFLTEYGDPRTRAAIKLVYVEPQIEEEYLARWSAARELSHPNLVRILAHGRCSLQNLSLVYVVMEYAEDDLGQVVRRRPLESAEALDVLENVVRALGYLHAQGMIHGHLNPGNILAVDDQIKLSTDCVRAAGAPGEIPEGPYAAPEASTGVSPAADVWALGVSLFEALTQKYPGIAADARDFSSIPSPFAEVISNALVEDPQARWTAARIAEFLKPPKPVPAEPVAVAAAPAPVAADVPESADRPFQEASGAAPERAVRSLNLFALLKSRHVALGAGFAAILFALTVGRKMVAPSLDADPPSGAAAVKSGPPVRAAAPAKPDLPKESDNVKAPAATAGGGWRVIVYTYAKRDHADKRVQIINGKWPQLKAEVYTSTKGGRHYLVTIGGSLTREQAMQLQRKARTLGLPRDTVARKI